MLALSLLALRAAVEGETTEREQGTRADKRRGDGARDPQYQT